MEGQLLQLEPARNPAKTKNRRLRRQPPSVTASTEELVPDVAARRKPIPPMKTTPTTKTQTELSVDVDRMTAMQPAEGRGLATKTSIPVRPVNHRSVKVT